jgi:NSS family neurotransmitter:Na+ symporter
MYVARSAGIEIFVGDQLASSTDLVFQILPALFHTIGGFVGVTLGVVFFLLLSIAALTSTISLLEVPVSYVIDEHQMERSKAAWLVGLGVTFISIIIAFQTSLIGSFSYIFSDLGLPIGGLLICLFIAFVWKKEEAINELEHGFPTIKQSLFAKVWPVFLYVICPAAIAYNIISNFL